MRKALARHEEERATYKGTFVRYGKKRNSFTGRDETTVLLSGIRDAEDKLICDHLWFNLTKAFEALNMEPGDVVQFDGRVTAYEKGYRGPRWDVDKPPSQDYKLSHPTKVRVISRVERGKPYGAMAERSEE